MCIEEKLMEEIEMSSEHREFGAAAKKLADKIRQASARVGYDLDAACSLVEDGHLTVLTAVPYEPAVFTGLPVEVGLFLTASACGALFPQAPAPRGQ